MAPIRRKRPPQPCRCSTSSEPRSGSGWWRARPPAPEELLAESGADAAFLRGKIALAGHFAGHLLPHAEGYFLAATQGAASVAAFDVAGI